MIRPNSLLEANKEEEKVREERQRNQNKTLGNDLGDDVQAPSESNSSTFMAIGVDENGNITFINPDGDFNVEKIIQSGKSVLNDPSISSDQRQKWRMKLCSMFKIPTESFSTEELLEEVASEMEKNIEKKDSFRKIDEEEESASESDFFDTQLF